MSPCDVYDCGRPRHSHGFCSSHAARLARYGDPFAGAAPRAHTREDRMARYIQRGPGDCWTWTGSLDQHGYGRAASGRRSHVQAHRFVFETLVGPIPAGLELDHLCRNRGCVNPEHVEPVTHHENLLRAHPPTSCASDACERLAVKRGLCNRHYIRQRRAGHKGVHRAQGISWPNP